MPTAPGKVLVVEDDPVAQEVTRYLLESEGYDVAVARNGQEALNRLRNGCRPNLILLDLMMPDMDGWQFRTAQKTDPELAEIPVVVSALAGDKIVGSTLQAVEVMAKPVEATKLLGTVRGIC